MIWCIIIIIIIIIIINILLLLPSSSSSYHHYANNTAHNTYTQIIKDDTDKILKIHVIALKQQLQRYRY